MLASGRMGASACERKLGAVFDTVAAEYDAHRPTYPEELIDSACAGLAAGDPVLEVGCGTGQLTRSLLARGLQVTAVDPGSRLLAVAAEQLREVRLVHAPFETADLPVEQFRALFSASAFHWVDPDLSWSRAANSLRPGGTLGLIQHCGIAAEDDQEALLEALGQVAPGVAATWPALRPLDVIMKGIGERSGNISDAWSWVGQYDLARPEGRLFADVRAVAAPASRRHSAVELIALLRTLSPYHRLTADQRRALESCVLTLEMELGRPIRSTTAAVLVTATKVGC